MKHDKLVRMANDIAAFFASQPGNRAAGVADHIRSFWTPAMRRQMYQHMDSGGEGLAPLALEALLALRSKDPAEGAKN